VSALTELSRIDGLAMHTHKRAVQWALKWQPPHSQEQVAIYTAHTRPCCDAHTTASCASSSIGVCMALPPPPLPPPPPVAMISLRRRTELPGNTVSRLSCGTALLLSRTCPAAAANAPEPLCLSVDCAIDGTDAQC